MQHDRVPPVRPRHFASAFQFSGGKSWCATYLCAAVSAGVIALILNSLFMPDPYVRPLGRKRVRPSSRRVRKRSGLRRSAQATGDDSSGSTAVGVDWAPRATQPPSQHASASGKCSVVIGATRRPKLIRRHHRFELPEFRWRLSGVSIGNGAVAGENGDPIGTSIRAIRVVWIG